MCQLWEAAGCNCSVENRKISSKRMRYETTVPNTLDFARSCIDFLRERVSRITPVDYRRAANSAFIRWRDGKKPGPFDAAEAITQIVYSKEANRSGEMG